MVSLEMLESSARYLQHNRQVWHLVLAANHAAVAASERAQRPRLRLRVHVLHLDGLHLGRALKVPAVEYEWYEAWLQLRSRVAHGSAGVLGFAAEIFYGLSAEETAGTLRRLGPAIIKGSSIDLSTRMLKLTHSLQRGQSREWMRHYLPVCLSRLVSRIARTYLSGVSSAPISTRNVRSREHPRGPTVRTS